MGGLVVEGTRGDKGGELAGLGWRRGNKAEP